MPERLFTRQPLLQWLEHNARLAAEDGVEFSDDVRRDAARLFAAVGRRIDGVTEP